MSFCFALATDPVDVIVVVVSSTRDATVAAAAVFVASLSLRTLTGEITGSTTSSVFRPSVALLMIILVDFRFGTLLLSPNLLLLAFFLVLALVLLRSRNLPDDDVEDKDRAPLLRLTGNLARRADGSRGADDEEECLFEIPIDGMVARWLRSTGWEMCHFWPAEGLRRWGG